MSEQQNKIPLPGELTDDDKRRQQFEILRPYLLDPREDYPEPYSILEFNGVPFSKVGGLAAISGQKKNGKSFVLTQLMAAILGNGSERVQTYLPGLTVPERTIEYIGHLPNVLYIDTEMEKLNTAKVLRRVHWLCGWEMRTPNERFNVLRLTNMPKDSDKQAYVQRFDMIRLAIDLIRPDVMFVDGLRDLLASINDEESITKTLDYFSGVAEESKMSIWMALHQNPNRKNDEDGLKMRGWAGTELGNKVSDTLVSIKTKTANGVTFTVKQQDARDKDIDDWKFEVTDDAGKLGIPKITSNGGGSKSKPIEYDSEDDIRKWIAEAANHYEWPMSRKSVKQLVFGEIGGVKNDGRQQADLMVAINTGMLVESTLKSGGYYMLTPNEQLPF
jgi:archaellum biogenesis ATPase FlaH